MPCKFIIFVNGYCGTLDAEAARTTAYSLGNYSLGNYLARKLRSCSPLESYWKGKGDEYLNKASSYFKDSEHKFVNGESWAASTAEERTELGRQYMTPERIKEYTDALSEGESISIVSHSMGAAFSEGMIEVMMKNEVLKKALESGQIVHFSSADAKDIKISQNSKYLIRYQLNTTNDHTLDYADPLTNPSDMRIAGVTRFGLVEWSLDKYHPKSTYLAHDSHYDTKTYAFSFDMVSDLKKVHSEFHHTSKIFTWTGGFKYINHYNMTSDTDTKFKSYKVGGYAQKFQNEAQKLYETKAK